MVGSTQIAGELGDRRFRLLVAQFLAVVRSVLRQHGGKEVDTAGDGMFAVFDGPAGALQAAVDTTAAVRTLGLEVRSGVHLGEVEQDADGRVGGIAVVLGARVMGLADRGEILTTRITSELAGGAGFDFSERGAHELKGIAGRHEIVAVTGFDGVPLEPTLDDAEARRRRREASSDAAAAPSARPISDQPGGARMFVGRARELAELHGALAAGAAGRGSLLLVSGEPGIGKSRLITTLADEAEESGWSVAIGRCWEGGGAPAYWPWIQAVRETGGEFERIAGLEAVAGASAMAEPLDPDSFRFRLFDRVGRYLAGVAEERPCLIVLEDLHAADEPSLLLLRFLASTADQHALMFVGTYRDGDSRVRELADLFGSLTQLGRRLPLRGLSTEEVGSFITLAGGAAEPDALARRVGEVTGGNPFFIGEIVRELAAQGRLDAVHEAESLPLPEEVRALIRRRLAGLSPGAVDLLRIGAVIGREFDLRVISSLTTLRPEELVEAVAEAERAGVVVQPRGSAGAYIFAHDLLRETLYEDLPAAERLKLHRTVAREFEALFREDLEPHLAEIARHFTAAAPLGESERAIEFSLRAADRSREVLAYEDAAALYERVLELLRPWGYPEQAAEILLKLGEVRSRAANADAAQHSFEQAAMLARRVGDAELFARAAIGYGEAELRANPGRPPAWTGTARTKTSIALLEAALALLPDEDGPLRARALAILAMELYTTEESERRLALSREALEMAMRVAQPNVLLPALNARHWALFAPDTLHERLANAQQMLAAATAAGNDEYAFLARHARAHCFLELCDAPAIDAEIPAMDQLAMRTRQAIYVWHVATLRGMRTLLEGQVDEAEQQMRRAFDESRRRLGENDYVRYYFDHAQLFAVRWAQGRLEELVERTREHSTRFPNIPRWRDLLVAIEVGDEPTVRQELERSARDGFSSVAWPGVWITHTCALAEACVFVGDATHAGVLYAVLAPYADRDATPIATLPFGPVAMRLAMLSAFRQRWPDAEEHFDRALRLCDAMGARAIRARVLIEQARMLRTRAAVGDDVRAGTALSEAAGLSEELQLPGLSKRVAALSQTGRS